VSTLPSGRPAAAPFGVCDAIVVVPAAQAPKTSSYGAALAVRATPAAATATDSSPRRRRDADGDRDRQAVRREPGVFVDEVTATAGRWARGRPPGW
jgi:hypothetical protein